MSPKMSLKMSPKVSIKKLLNENGFENRQELCLFSKPFSLSNFLIETLGDILRDILGDIE